MRTKLLLISLCVVWFASIIKAEVNSSLLIDPNISKEPNQAKAAIITCTGLIDDGLYSSIKRRANSAVDMGATYIILEIETYGGLVKSADDISKFLILDLSKRARTVAYVNTEAISAGAMISVSCQDIIMRANTTIGDCAPIQMGGESMADVEREKTESFIRAVFERAAQANNYPEPLLKAMVSRHIKVWRVKNLETGKYEFFEDKNLPANANAYDINRKELIDNENEILTLTARKANEYGIARAVVNDVNEAIAFLAKRDNVKFAANMIKSEPNWSEQLVRMLNHPTVSGILFMVGMLAVYMELKSPGLGLPGLLALICFGIIFGSRFLTGMATWWEIAVFAVGVALLAVEIFILPGFGFAGVLGILFILISIFAILVPNRPDELPWPKPDLNNSQWNLLSNGAWSFTLGFIGFVVLAYILSKFLPKTSFWSNLIIAPAQPGVKLHADVTAAPESDAVLAIGMTGTAITILRPSGKAKFGEAIADVVAEGDYIQKEKAVKIVLIQGNRVVVR
jgi:membrane-bound serine protease (ClpP class)